MSCTCTTSWDDATIFLVVGGVAGVLWLALGVVFVCVEGVPRCAPPLSAFCSRLWEGVAGALGALFGCFIISMFMVMPFRDFLCLVDKYWERPEESCVAWFRANFILFSIVFICAGVRFLSFFLTRTVWMVCLRSMLFPLVMLASFVVCCVLVYGRNFVSRAVKTPGYEMQLVYMFIIGFFTVFTMILDWIWLKSRGLIVVEHENDSSSDTQSDHVTNEMSVEE